MLRPALCRVESVVTAFERALIVALLSVMVGAVFLDAIHRLFAAEEGRLARLVVVLLPAGLAGPARRVFAPVLLFLATFVIASAALRSRAAALAEGGQLGTPPSRWRSRLGAAGLTLALAGATQVLVRALPNGLVWSQQMALCFLLWVALAGASLGAREHAHLAFELAGVIWPAPLRRPVERLARLIAAAFTLFLAVLAAAHTREHYLEWRTSGGAAGLFVGFPVPRFLIFGFLPLPFTVTALRFLAYGVRPDGPRTPSAEEPGR